MAPGKKTALCSFLFMTLCTAPALAGEAPEDDMSLNDQIRQLQQRMESLEKKVQDQESHLRSQNDTISSQEERISRYENQPSGIDRQPHRQFPSETTIGRGLEIGAGATFIVQGTDNTNAGDNPLNDSRTDSSYSADITLEKEFEKTGGTLFLHLEAGEGAGLEDDLALYSNVNRDAGDSDNGVEVTELWYEQTFLQEKAAVTFGKLDPTAYCDLNEVANDETTQFLGRIFRNSPTVEFPDNTAGVRLAYRPFERIEWEYNLFDGDGDWEKTGDHLFNIGQITFKTDFFDRPGHYRFYGWHNNTPHTRWTDTGKTKEDAYGFGLSFDQAVGDYAAVFTRYGWQNPKVYNPDLTASDGSLYSLERSWSAGLQVEGPPWGREHDVLAFAVGQIRPSDDYKNATGVAAKTEGHLEAYYRIHVNDHLSVSPDFQYIWHPFGKDIAGDTSPVYLYGLRSQIDF